jgi:hypothetical protein
VLRPKNPHRRFLGNLISASDFRNGLLVPDARPFLLNFPGFSHGDAVQEHSNAGFAAVQRGFPLTEPIAQNCKTLIMGSNPIVASESKRFTKFYW